MKFTKILLTLIICLTTFSCVGIGVRPYNEEEKCWEKEQEVTSEFRLFGGCDETLAVTKKDGEYWLFSDQCVPDDYTRVDEEDKQHSILCDD